MLLGTHIYGKSIFFSEFYDIGDIHLKTCITAEMPLHQTAVQPYNRSRRDPLKQQYNAFFLIFLSQLKFFYIPSVIVM